MEQEAQSCQWRWEGLPAGVGMGKGKGTSNVTLQFSVVA
jgi:hypothetical protein